MEFEQIVKQLEWLDQEHRNDKQTLSDLQNRSNALEATLSSVTNQLKSLGRQTAEAETAMKRLEQFDAFLASQRSDMSQALDGLEKKHQQRERESLERSKAELDAVHKALAGLREGTDPETRRKFKERADEAQRLTASLGDFRARLEEIALANQEILRSQATAAEVRNQDLKRISELQAELAAQRKRSDEVREQNLLLGDSLRNTENRLNELLASEAGRGREQATFLEEQARAQVERERGWKEWNLRFERLTKQADAFEAQISAIDETMRGAKRAQETYQELNTKLERRINEITELQRLGEDRLRQEWIAFKSDDQKRWTGYTLGGEESTRDLRKDMQKAEARVAAMDELTQTLQDQLHQTADATEQQLKELIDIYHEWMTSYERIMGHSRKPARK